MKKTGKKRAKSYDASMNISQRRLILKVFVFTMLFSGILLFLYRGNNVHLPQRADHHYQDKKDHTNPGPYKNIEPFSGSLSGLQQDVENDLQDVLNSLGYTDHNSAVVESLARKKYEDMCRVFDSLCKLVSRNGEFNRQEYYYYQSIFISLVRYLDKTVNYSPDLSNILQRISFYKDDSGRRGGADHTKIRINAQLIASHRELREVLTHEAGHIIDFGIIGGSMPALDTSYTEFGQPEFYVDDPSLSFYRYSRKNELVKNADASYKDFVSGYAMQDPFEDWAETVNMYVNHYELFAQMADTSPILKQKFVYMEYLFLKYTGHPNTSATTRTLDPSERLWDTTKLYSTVSP